MKKNLYKGLMISVLTLFVFTSVFSFEKGAKAETDFLNINADAAIMIEASTGKILYQKNVDTVLGIASMTKMMTEYLLLEAIHENRVKWDQSYTVSDYVYRISQDRSLSNVPLVQGGSYKVIELYESMAIYSANGATIALAEIIAGSETNFVNMMNQKALELGLEDYRFINSTGLNNSDLQGNHPEGTDSNAENVMSARATAKLAYHLYNDFPEIINTASISKKVFREDGDYPIQMDNWNWMLPGLILEYQGVDGIKTGFTQFAGYCFTGTAERNGMRFITVVMNAKLDYETTNYREKAKARFNETRKMLDYAFSNYTVKELYPSGYQIAEESTLPVIKGKEQEVSIHTKKSISSVIKRNEEDLYKPVYIIDKEILTGTGELVAPVEENTPVGYMTLEYTGEVDFGFITDNGENQIKADLVTKESVEKANWFVLMMRGISSFFADLWTSVSDGVTGIFS